MTVWLGMTKEEVLKKLSAAGVAPKDFGDEIRIGTDGDAHILHFKNNRLVFTDLEWYTEHTGDEIDAVLGALAQKNNGHPCELVHAPLSDPSLSLDRVFVVCGQRSVMISKGKFQGKLLVDVTERIGDMPSREQ